MKGHIDIKMGGIYRDRGLAGELIPGGDIYNLIEEIITNTLNENNAVLQQYLTELYEILNGDIYNAGDEITQEMKEYFQTVVNSLNQVIQEIITGGNVSEEFVTYVQNLIDDLETYVTNLTLGDEFTQVFKDYIDNLITEITNIYGNPTLEETLKTYIDNLFAALEQNTFNIGDEITQEMIDYFQTILDQLTITKDQITNLDEISQEFKDYIDQLFQDFEDYITNNLILGDEFTEVIKNYIDESLEEIKTVLEQFITEQLNENFNQSVTNIIKKYYDYTNATRLISGTITHLQDLDFLISPLVYEILGDRIESPENTVTIPANVANDPMYAVLYADVFGNTGYILGVPAANPAVPLVDPSTQLALTTVYIPALGTEPGTDPGGEVPDITEEIIYDENIEWATAKIEEAGLTINFDAAADPSTNAKHISLQTGAGTIGFERLPIQIEENIDPFDGVGVGIFAETTDWITVLGNHLIGHMSDYTKSGVRHIGYYLLKNKAAVNAFLVSKTTGIVYPSVCWDIVYTTFAIAELGFSVKVPQSIKMRSAIPLPIGSYKIVIEPGGFTRYDQMYNVVGSDVLTPQTSLLSFTRATAVSAENANVLVDLKSSGAWLPSTGLLFEIYKGIDKIGSLPFLPGNYYGFNPGNAAYQRITLPLADFNLTAAEFDKLVVKPINSWPAALTFKIDNVVLQSGVISVPQPDEIIEDIAFEFRDVSQVGDTYVLDLAASFAYKILEAVLKTDAGTITAKLTIAGTDVTGLAAPAVDNTIQTFPGTALNSVAKNQLVQLEITAIAGAAALTGKLRLKRI